MTKCPQCGAETKWDKEGDRVCSNYPSTCGWLVTKEAIVLHQLLLADHDDIKEFADITPQILDNIVFSLLDGQHMDKFQKLVDRWVRDMET